MEIYNPCCLTKLDRRGFGSGPTFSYQNFRCQECHQIYRIWERNEELHLPELSKTITTKLFHSKTTPKLLLELHQKGYLQREYRNQECLQDCQRLETLGGTSLRESQMCGEGEFTRLMKCRDCHSLYFLDTYSDCWPEFDDVFGSIRYDGTLTEEQLKIALPKITGTIGKHQLSLLEALLK